VRPTSARSTWRPSHDAFHADVRCSPVSELSASTWSAALLGLGMSAEREYGMRGRCGVGIECWGGRRGRVDCRIQEQVWWRRRGVCARWASRVARAFVGRALVAGRMLGS